MEQATFLLPFIYLIGGGIITLTIKIVFEWLKKPKNDLNGEAMKYIRCPLDRANTIADIKWLKEVHDKNDSTGLPLFYMPRGLEVTMNKLVDATTKQTLLLERMLGLLSANGIRLETLIKNGNSKHKAPSSP